MNYEYLYNIHVIVVAAIDERKFWDKILRYVQDDIRRNQDINIMFNRPV